MARRFPHTGWRLYTRDAMKPGLTVGNVVEHNLRVTQEMCPHFDGVLVHPVLATWTLVHHMEICGRKALAPYLDDHEEGVGTHISIDHRGMAPIGSSVVVRATVSAVGARRLTCEMEAMRPSGVLIATGLFVQAILPKLKLKALLDAAQGSSAPDAE